MILISKKEMPGFMIYRDVMEILSLVSDEQAGQAVRLAVRYYRGEKYDLPEDLIVLLVLNNLRREIDRSRERYQEICDRNAENARKRWNAGACGSLRDDANNNPNDNDNLTITT